MMKLTLPLQAKVTKRDFSKDILFTKSLFSELRDKSDELATHFRQEGNKFFENGRFMNALITYNKVISIAESDEQLALLYGNRSAVCLGLKKYEECLQNIQLARDHNYPRDKIQKLQNREQKCLELMATEKKFDVSDFLKLSFEPNPKVSYLIDGLEVRTDENNEKGIFATRNLKVGDIICIEEFIKTSPILGNRVHTEACQMCSVCSKLKTFTLIPCKTCNFAMFCNEKCQKYHELNECHNSDFTFDDIPTWMIYPFSIFNKLLAKVDASIDELEKLWNKSQKNPKTIFDLELSNPDDPECQKNQLRAFLSLKKREKFPYLERNGILKIDSKHKSKAKFIENFLEWIFGISIVEVNQGLGASQALLFSTFSPLIRRSCAPNVQPFSNDGKFSFIVIRSIAAGEQIFQKSVTFETYSFEMRKEMHLFAIGRLCDCVACQNPKKYTLLEDLKHVPNERLDSAVKKYENFNFDSATKTELMKAIREMSEILQSSTADYPYRNYVKGERILCQLFMHLGETRS